MSKNLGNPFDFDVTQFLQGLTLPGLDTQALIDAHQRNLEALTAANRVAMDTATALLARKSEAISQTLKEVNTAIQKAQASTSPQQFAEQQMDMARSALAQALTHLRDMSAMVGQSNQQAMDIMSKRVTASLQEVTSLLAPAAKKK